MDGVHMVGVHMERGDLVAGTGRAAARTVALALAGVLALAPGGAQASFLDDLMSSTKSLFSSPREPDVLPGGEEEEIDCPKVDVFEGGSALRIFSGGRTDDPGALMNQLSISDVARECGAGPNDSVVLKVGVEVRALLGPAGRPGNFSAPLTILVKRGDHVVARRARTLSVAIPAGGSQGQAAAVEEGIAVPPGKGDLLIEVGLGRAEAAGEPRQERRRR